MPNHLHASPLPAALVLIVEDDAGLAELTAATLGEQGCETAHASTGAEALAWMADHVPTLLLLDYALPDMTGLQLLDRVGRPVPFMVTTGAGDERTAVSFMKHGARDYLVKDTRFLDNLPVAVNRVLRQLDTEARLAEALESLRLREAKISGIYAAAPIGIAVDVNGQLQEVNEALCRMTGYTRAELLSGRTRMLFLEDADYAHVDQEVRRIMAGPATGSVETRLRRKTGLPVDVLLSMAALDAADIAKGSILTALDITEHKRAEQALRESEERHRLLLQNANDAIYVHEISPQAPGRFIEVNDRACLMLGYTREEFMAMTVPQIDVVEHAEKRAGIVRQLHASGSAVFETEHRAKDGHRVPVEVSTRLFHLRGKPLVLSVVRDITDRKRSEESLRQSEETARTLINATRDEAFMMDLNGTALALNDEMARRLGRRPEDVLGGSIFDSLPPDVAAHRRAKVEEVAQSGRPVRFEDEHDGRFIDNSIYPLCDAQGRVTRVAVFGRDITEARLAQSEQARQLDELRRWQSVTLGREGRIAELKREVNSLAVRLGLPPTYFSVGDGEPEVSA